MLSIYHSKNKGRAAALLNSYAAFVGGGEQAILRGSLKKETVNFHLSYREKALSFSLTLKRHSESHTTLTRFHYKNVPKY